MLLLHHPFFQWRCIRWVPRASHLLCAKQSLSWGLIVIQKCSCLHLHIRLAWNLYFILSSWQHVLRFLLWENCRSERAFFQLFSFFIPQEFFGPLFLFGLLFVEDLIRWGKIMHILGHSGRFLVYLRLEGAVFQLLFDFLFFVMSWIPSLVH